MQQDIYYSNTIKPALILTVLLFIISDLCHLCMIIAYKKCFISNR